MNSNSFVVNADTLKDMHNCLADALFEFTCTCIKNDMKCIYRLPKY